MENLEKKVDELLSRGVAEVIDQEHLRKRLLSGDKLRVKLGIDPTSPNLHIGRSIPLLKLRDFQELGHSIVFIVGDFTGVIGDTSDKESERSMLSPETIADNMKSYAEQAGKIIDLSKAEIRYNSEWLGKLDYAEIGKQADSFSLAEFIARENIKKRLDEGKRVSLRELLYPLMQGYDSVAVKADVELGGTDQRFNLLAGRHLQPLYDQESQDILMNDLILGTDGRKMSSSWGNTINLTDTPEVMFKKVMDIPDALVETYFTHCTRVPLESVKNIVSGDHREAHFALASEFVRMYHGEESIQSARERYETVAQGGVPEDIREIPLSEKLIDLLAENGLASSKSDARRKIEQGGVSIDGEKILDAEKVLGEGDKGKIVKVGKNDFVKLS